MREPSEWINREKEKVQGKRVNIFFFFFYFQGDLVQLKQLPVQGAFELKGKAMDVLVTVSFLGLVPDARRNFLKTSSPNTAAQDSDLGV